MRFFLFLMLSVFTFSNCSEKSEQEIVVEDQEKIEQYLVRNNITAEITESGVHYFVTKEGNGEFATVDQEFTVDYRGFLLSGQLIDASISPLTFSLDQVIVGWREGILQFSKGGAGFLFIPSQLAYGSQAVGQVPSNSVLIFEIELIDFN